tara:strand:+ start:186 stop:668 length:483 start_codon:yes stop_codon:yes gene_type:complete
MPTHVVPVDKTMYARVKKSVYKNIPKHSAYRSGILVKKYKKSFAKKYGNRKQPYTFKKGPQTTGPNTNTNTNTNTNRRCTKRNYKKCRRNLTKKTGLTRWFDEKWVNQRGEVGYKYKNDIYRPTHRITKKTPITHKELSNKEIRRARTKKYRKGRVHRFR